MEFDRIRIKSNARLFYKNNTGTSICAVLIYEGISLGETIATYILAAILTVFGLAAGGTTPRAAEFSVAETIRLANNLLSAITGLALVPLTMGLQNWFRQSIYEKTPLTDIFKFYTGGRFWGSVGTYLLMSVYTWLWSMLFIVPGIIKAYSYSQTLYIKAENPDIPASRAIELSSIMMAGHKWQLCVFEFTFFGWQLLSLLTLNILGIVYVQPYYYAALAFAYEEIKAEAIARGVIDRNEISPSGVQEIMPPPAEQF